MGHNGSLRGISLTRQARPHGSPPRQFMLNTEFGELLTDANNRRVGQSRRTGNGQKFQQGAREGIPCPAGR